MSRPALALTMGDPAGVGPELCLRAAANPSVVDACVPVIVGSAKVLEAVARKLDLPVPDVTLRPGQIADGFRPENPGVVDLDNIGPDDFAPGQVSAACGQAAFDYIASAVEHTRAGRFGGITTAPISKQAVHEAGIPFPGHTELLAELTASGPPVMMLHSPRLTVALVTTHLALRAVPGMLDAQRIAHVVSETHAAMARLLGRAPCIAVLALNCHAGEGGLFGDEEAGIIAPAIDAARSAGLDVEGPIPPDTAFTPVALDHYDAHVCMYHDQGLVPFKALSFRDGVNVTLGISIVRTSPAHGTAFDIAWQGKADPSSLVAALVLAARMTG